MTKTILDTCNFFYSYAETTWNRIRFARLIKQRISETTLTENLIFDFWYQAKKGHLPVEIYEAKDEKSNGNDLEIFIETGLGFLLLVCQAKIINKQGKYAHINHKVGRRYQIDLLTEYSKRKKGLATYLFYNYIEDHLILTKLKDLRENRETHFGISCCPAGVIKNKYFDIVGDKITKHKRGVPKFEDLHPDQAIPLANIICNLLHNNTAPILGFFASHERHGITYRYFERGALTNDESWQPILRSGQIGFVETQKEQNDTSPIQQDGIIKGFNPKYRIVFSVEQARRGLFRIS